MRTAEGWGSGGVPLVALPGWSFRAALWRDACPWLGERHRVCAVDLPGHASGLTVPPGDCPVDFLARVAPPRAIWLGWSLGAQLALAFARRFPQRVAALVMMAYTPRLLAAADWPGGQAAPALAGLRQRLDTRPEAALREFATLCARGAGQRPCLRHLRRQQVPAGQAQGLDWGLEWLQHTDQRSWPPPACPALWLHGTQDALIPPQLAQRQAARWGLTCRLVTGAGHAPFVSHPEACRAVLQPWLARLPSAGTSAGMGG